MLKCHNYTLTMTTCYYFPAASHTNPTPAGLHCDYRAVWAAQISLYSAFVCILYCNILIQLFHIMYFPTKREVMHANGCSNVTRIQDLSQLQFEYQVWDSITVDRKMTIII